ncbi:hypothetical protein SGO26_27720 [Cupriavidus metallidurans]|uniref:hypothetical protein n=1 Tax=Cupriavidus TaxID=106589 RepID=UPI0002A409D7|nr:MULTISPECIES: hypothetical protein [Cupriavidus]ELA01300.1 hypothetical protein D769_01307 [Cupriavidus sp. HMR-1]GMG92397.1 hypothetical protein Cmtc_36170 [Cupriavidus sp. TKC]HBD35554.1 hypothetical protein [Cupriavidus sp.]HBO76745.1 hypothetical protein [Cupriavidus sp.]
MDAYPTATYKGYDIYPLVYRHTDGARAWGEPRPDRSFNAAVVICREGAHPDSTQARTFHLDTTPWDNVGAARRAVLRYAEEIINGEVTGQSVVTL